MMPSNLDELVDFQRVLDKKQFIGLKKNWENTAALNELLHLAIRLIHPDNKTPKFTQF